MPSHSVERTARAQRLIVVSLIAVGLGARWVAVLFVVEYAITSLVLKVPRQPPFGGWDSMRIDLMLLAASIMLVLVGPGALALAPGPPLP